MSIREFYISKRMKEIKMGDLTKIEKAIDSL